MSEARTLLQAIGFERREVVRITATLGARTAEEASAQPTAANYLTGEEQVRTRRVLTQNQTFILGMAIGGCPPLFIAACCGVSSESVMRRLRAYGMTRPAHRPKALA